MPIDAFACTEENRDMFQNDGTAYAKSAAETICKSKNEKNGSYTEREFMLEVEQGVEIQVLVSTPKEQGPHPAFIFAHGGGGCLMNADAYRHLLIEYGIEFKCVTFNVDYRLAPATKAPGGVLDFYKTIKYVINNAAEFGVDPSKIVIAGESGGSMICLGAAYELTKNDEAGLIKNMWLQCPMLSNEIGLTPLSELNYNEQLGYTDMQNFYKMLATNVDNQ